MTIASILAIGAVAYLGLVFLVQRSVLFPRPPTPRTSVADGRPDVEVAWVGPEGGAEVWFLRPRGGSGPTPVLIFTHGNGELIDYWIDEFDVPRGWGLAVLLVEYPGYGRSGGRPSEASISAAVGAAYDYAASRADVDRDRIVAYGRSVGGGPASALARDRDVAAVVLESAFTSVRDLARRYGLVGPLVLDPFDNLAALRGYQGPLLVLHGKHDRVIPFRHGQKLAATAPGADFMALDCGHNDCPRPWTILREFLIRHEILIPGAEGVTDR